MFSIVGDKNNKSTIIIAINIYDIGINNLNIEFVI